MGSASAFVASFDAVRATSPDALLSASELAMVLPAAVLATLPFWEKLRWRRSTYVTAVVALTLALLAASPVVAGFGAPTNNVLLPALGAFFVFYVWAIDAPLAKKAGVYLSVAMFAAFVSYAAIIVDAFFGGGGSVYLAVPGAVAQWGLCAAVFALIARPMYAKLPAILDGPAAGGRFWELFWILPLAMTSALVFLVPEDSSTLLYRRVGLAAVVGVAALFVLTCLSYALFIRLASQAAATLAAQKAEGALQLQLLMQTHLEERMDEARRARHDLRQHDRAVRGFIDAGDLAGLAAYLDEHESRTAESAPIHVCDNPAVNAVAVYYWDAALRAGAAVDMQLDLPRHVSVAQDELVVVLGNLLENAVEALEGVEAGGRLSAHAHRDPQGAVFIRISNSCVAAPAITAGGIASTKHAGAGLGTASVRAIAEASGGVASFSCKDGVFTADVMLGA